MKKILLSLFFACFIYACSLEQVKSSENYITELKIDGIDMLEVSIKNDIRAISVYTVPENFSKLSAIKREITISDYAKLDSIGTDWTTEGFLYKVTAENDEVRDYTIEIEKIYKKYSFETFVSSNGYYVPVDSNSFWSSGNNGISMALAILEIDNKNPKSYPTRDTVDIYGKAVLMETIEGGEVFGRDIHLFSGNFFLGNFNASKAIIDELSAVELGRIYLTKPKSVKGFYKYKEGADVFKENGVENPNRRDSCNMNFKLYRSGLPNGKDTTLTVKNIDSSDLVIAEAKMPACVETVGEDFVPFELEFIYTSEPNFEEHRYKLAATFAASKYGDSYTGKIGSKLIIDEIEFVD